MHLFDSEREADQAVNALALNNFPKEAVEKVALNQTTDLYTGKGVSILDLILSGAFGGVAWGILFGILAIIGIVQTAIPSLVGITSISLVWALVLPGAMFPAALIGGAMGYFIGMGIAEEDSYHSQESANRGKYIVRALVDENRFREAITLMDPQRPRPAESLLEAPIQA